LSYGLFGEKVQEKKESEEHIKVFYDYRERESRVPDILREWKIEVVEQTLEVGDYICSDSIAVERKDGGDFVNSVFSGRLFEQARNLCDVYQNPLILVEGKFETGGFSSKTASSIRGAIISLAIDFNLPVLFTYDCGETAEYIRMIARREQIERRKGIIVHRGKRPKALWEKQLFLVSGLPGISGKIAQNLLSAFGTPEHVFTANEKELQEVEKIGRLKARRIREILTSLFSPEE